MKPSCWFLWIVGHVELEKNIGSFFLSSDPSISSKTSFLLWIEYWLSDVIQLDSNLSKNFTEIFSYSESLLMTSGGMVISSIRRSSCEISSSPMSSIELSAFLLSMNSIEPPITKLFVYCIGCSIMTFSGTARCAPFSSFLFASFSSRERA